MAQPGDLVREPPTEGNDVGVWDDMGETEAWETGMGLG